MATVNAPRTARARSAQDERPCVACQGRSQRLVYHKWGFPIFRCEACGLGRAGVAAGFDPRSLYGRGYFQGQRRDGYADYAGSEGVLRQEFRRAVEHLRRVGPQSGKLLEVGCAYGFFLEEARPYFEACGVDVAQCGVDFARARGLNARCAELSEELLAAEGPLDAVVMLDVIEHLADPAATLALLHGAMKPGASLLLSTGDWQSLAARALGRHWRLLTPPQHLYYFSRRSLAAILGRSGFEVIDCVRPWKRVPLGLAAYQVLSRLGLRVRIPEALNRAGLPLNLFDALRLVARRRG